MHGFLPSWHKIKSTLADRLLEYCGNLSRHQMLDRMLDKLGIETERVYNDTA